MYMYFNKFDQPNQKWACQQNRERHFDEDDSSRGKRWTGTSDDTKNGRDLIISKVHMDLDLIREAKGGKDTEK